MKRNICPLFLAILTITISCKKDNSNAGLASINIVNAAIDVPSIYTYLTFSDSAYYRHRTSIGYGSSLEYGIPSGESPISLISSADTTKALLERSFPVKAGCVYSLYITGQASAIDTLFLQDVIPFHSDSVAEVRIINLSKGSGTMTVNLEGNSQPDFTALAYKEISAFKSYAVTNGITSYNFEVRDQKTGNLMTTFTWNFTVFKSSTLVISGSTDDNSPSPLGIFQVNNF